MVLFADCYRRTRQFVTGFLARFGVTHTLVPPGRPRRARARHHRQDAARDQRDADQPVPDLRRPRPARAPSARAHARQDADRQHLRHAHQPAPGRARHRPGRAQRHQVPGRPQRRAGGRGGGQRGPGRAGARPAPRVRRGARPARGLPGAPRHQDPRPARGPAEQDAPRPWPSCLERHPKVKQVWYPGLPSHPHHAIAKTLHERLRRRGHLRAQRRPGRPRAASSTRCASRASRPAWAAWSPWSSSPR